MIPKAIPMELRHIVFLLVSFILYVILGGIVFMLLESPEEQIKRKEIAIILNNFTEHIKRLNHANFTEQNFRLLLHQLLVAQNNNLIDNFGNQQPINNWSFINSFFFAITVITTVGYGHLTPSTVFGKIFCIIYALFGIPITSLLIGSVADRFSKLYSTKKARIRGLQYRRQISTRLLMLKKGLISLVPWFFVFLIVPAIIFRHIEQWSFLDGFYYCFVSLSTIGFGDFVAGKFEKNFVTIYKIVIVFWIIFGLAYLSMVLNFITNALRSRHISNVVQSLRLKIHSNGVSRVRRQECPYPEHFKRPQSSPIVIYNQNKRIIQNNNFIHETINHKKDNSLLIDLKSKQKRKNHQKMDVKFWKLFKMNKRKRIKNKNSLKCAFDEAIIQTNSLPELSTACIGHDFDHTCKITIV